MSDINKIQSLVDAIRPLLVRHPPEIEGAALANLLAIWLAGHITPGKPKETAALHERLLQMHLRAVRELIPVNETINAARKS